MAYIVMARSRRCSARTSFRRCRATSALRSAGSSRHRAAGASMRARLYIGAISAIADGMSIAWVWTCRYSEWPPCRGGHFEYRHVHTRATDMPSAMAEPRPPFVPLVPCGTAGQVYSYGLYRYGLYSYGLHRYGLYSYGLHRYGL